MRKKISERQIGKLPARVLEKNKIGKAGFGSTRVNEFLIFAHDIGAEIEIRKTGNKFTVSGCPPALEPVLDAFWTESTWEGQKGFGGFDGDSYVITSQGR